MGNVFGEQKTMKQIIREQKRMVDRSVRSLERDRQNLERDEKKLINDIKKSSQRKSNEIRKNNGKGFSTNTETSRKICKFKCPNEGDITSNDKYGKYTGH